MNKYSLYVAVVMFQGASCAATSQLNYLEKVFRNEGNLSDKVVCYFTKEPICNKLPNKIKDDKTAQESLVYFIPMTTVQGSETKNMLKKLHTSKKNGYTILFKEVKYPIKGIKVTIGYDSSKIMCDYQKFDAITGSKGLVFSFHNKDVLSKLKLSTDPVLHYAWNLLDTKKKPKIMLDIGHGGSDEGKIGCFQVQEKVINFQVGTKVATFLKKAGYDVFLTRNADYFVALDDRTSNANKKKVDLFLSIHANAGATNAASGIETYWLDSKLLKKNSSGQHETIQKLMVMRDIQSCLLAQNVHKSVIEAAKKVYAVNDRKVKTSVTQVLLGTDITMPAALIEIGFLSNQQETKLLMDRKYQTTIAQAIAEGIMSYFKECKIS